MNRWRRTRVGVDNSHVERSREVAVSNTSESHMNDTHTGNASPVAIHDVLDKVSLIIAPPTLVIALAYWFGWTETNARSKYFGIDSSMLGYSTTDYLLRSADAFFVPIAVILLATLIVITLHGFVRHAVTAHEANNAVKRGAACAATLGAFLVFFGAWAMFRPLPLVTSYLVPPVILGLGPALIAYSVWVLRHIGLSGKRRKEYTIPAWERSGYMVAATLALLGVFWASSLYAAALGRGRAEVLAENLSNQPAVTVFSLRSLGIDAPGVTSSKIASIDAAYKFRYSGLRLLIRSANKYFLINDAWSRERGVIIVLQDTSDIRLEFTPGD
jgi:hypothetical protein